MPALGMWEIRSLLWERVLRAALRHQGKSERKGWNTQNATISDLLKCHVSYQKNSNSSRESSVIVSLFPLRSESWTAATCCSPLWLSVHWAALPRCLPEGFLPALAGRACPRAWAEPFCLSSCTWVWRHTSHLQLLFLGCWLEPVTGTEISNLETVQTLTTFILVCFWAHEPHVTAARLELWVETDSKSLDPIIHQDTQHL